MMSQSTLGVRKTITVRASQTHAFAVFTESMNAWWPLQTHHIGREPAQAVVLEPHAGGRWFERGTGGSECDWGRILIWEPPHRVVLSWEISPDWQHDPKSATEVEIRFIAEGSGTTRVELEHRHLERYGDKAEQMRSIFDSDSGWTGLLQRFQSSASAAA